METICMRCGYPVRMPEYMKQYKYNNIKTCRMCRTPKENEIRDRNIAKYLEHQKEKNK